jgi:2-polyprenyl-3-methyl-5-hydroxy-6-metoxy-1,4-benzoquinol methylase
VTHAARDCPVCGTPTDWSAGTRVAADQVWARLEEQFRVTVPAPVRAHHAPAGHWMLVVCGGCGLEHFPDAPQGDETFYALLTGSGYYETSRWEFGVAGAGVRAGSRVVDIGCGDGAFLRGLPQRARRTGLDHNGAALETLRRLDPGVLARQQDAGEHASEVGPVYDVVTAFQILEHVEQPRELLAAARALVAPGGAVFVSVPNRDRTGRQPFEVLDHPPHHLTHWRAQQLATAAQGEGLRLAAAHYEPPDHSIRVEALTAYALGRLSALPSAMAVQGSRVVRRVGELRLGQRLLIARGFYARRQLTGHTLLARLEPV